MTFLFYTYIVKSKKLKLDKKKGKRIKPTLFQSK